MESLTVAINCLGLAGGFRLGKSKRDGWLLGLGATIVGACLNWHLAIFAGLAFNAVGLFVNIKGYHQWRKRDKEKAKGDARKEAVQAATIHALSSESEDRPPEALVPGKAVEANGSLPAVL